MPPKSGCGTFEVQILGSVDVLGDRLCVHLERVRVGSVPRDDHIVPLVVVQRVVAVPLQQAGPVPQVEHVVDEPGGEIQTHRNVSLNICFVPERKRRRTHQRRRPAHPLTSSTAMKSLPSPLLKMMKPSGEVVLNWKKRCMVVYACSVARPR